MLKAFKSQREVQQIKVLVPPSLRLIPGTHRRGREQFFSDLYNCDVPRVCCACTCLHECVHTHKYKHRANKILFYKGIR